MTKYAHLRTLALAAILLAPLMDVAAQNPAGGGPAVLQQPYWQDASYVNAHGEPLVHPASYGQPYGPAYGPACGPAYGPGCGAPYGDCGGGPGGCGRGGNLCGGGLGLCRGCLHSLFGGVSPTEQCGPHYFDFSAEYLHLNRDAPLGDSTVLSTFGFANDDLSNVPEQTALTGEGVPGGELDGYRLTGRLDIGALSFFEVSYAGLYSSDDEITVRPDLNGDITPGDATDDNPLFSIFSRYGTATNGLVGEVGAAGEPNAGVQGTAQPGVFFDETDSAEEQSLDYESELHSVEASIRRYWVGYNPRISGTLLVGFRYTELQELLQFYSANIDSGADGEFFTGDDSVINSIDIGLGADNHLAGVQIGGDVWASIVQGFRIGGEIKAGLYNNDYEIRTSTVASDGDPAAVSRQSDNHVAFLTEAKAMAVVNITPSLSLKGGYEVLFISDLANLGDNLLANPPYGEDSLYGAAPPRVNEEGEAFWDGFHFGMEYTY